MPIRLVIADDHPIFLGGLQQLLGLEKDFELIAVCGGGAAALEAILRDPPDVAVLDIRMGGMGGLEVARRLAGDSVTRTRLVLLTASIAEEEAIEAVRLGVRGVLLKEMAPRLLIECIRKVHAGERWIEKGSFGQVVEKLARREAAAAEIARALTPRELEIVRLVGRGLRNREIAENLYVSEGTIKAHLHKIFKKLKVRTRSTLARYAVEKGLT